jgi:hypothetical protein
MTEMATAPAYTGVDDMRRIAKELLEKGDVRVIIGWEDARRGARPVFVTDPAQTDKLIFDTRCVHNLVTYLNPRRDHVSELGKIGLVVKGCDVKAVAGLLREAQLRRDDAVPIGAKWKDVVDEAVGKVRELGPYEAYRALAPDAEEPWPAAADGLAPAGEEVAS